MKNRGEQTQIARLQYFNFKLFIQISFQLEATKICNDTKVLRCPSTVKRLSFSQMNESRHLRQLIQHLGKFINPNKQCNHQNIKKAQIEQFSLLLTKEGKLSCTISPRLILFEDPTSLSFYQSLLQLILLKHMQTYYYMIHQKNEYRWFV
ncbi:Hypothetical_protein [Hexamita inflata]|uniref:Hypothetical_protein n=1 Tax=Hexamita inflata TaxID=28002 RepID=A0AA86TUV5_9EUKA|nr:Hypothetical protein HINF_LOCUS17219 [Hexamita inflata]